MPIDEENCGECSLVCDPYTHRGAVCDTVDGQCYCEDDGDCNDFIGGGQVCTGEGTDASCSCRSFLPVRCTGGGVSQCCGIGPGAGCRNLLTDAENCGRCGVACSAGMECRMGACECDFPDSNCPKNSPAPDCVPPGLCICAANLPDSRPCGEGRFCCDGNHGGTGGPDDGPDEGCCWKACGKNLPGDCLF